MSFAGHLRTTAQHDDWRGYVCKVTNGVLTAFLTIADRHAGSDADLRTYMLIVACALDDGGLDAVSAPEGGVA